MSLQHILSSSLNRIHFIQINQKINLSINNIAKRGFQLTLNLLQTSKPETSHGEILYGRSVCNIALKVSRRPVFRLHVLNRWRHIEPEDERVAEVFQLAADRNIPLHHTSRRQLDLMACYRPHQGVCLEVGELPYMNLNKASYKRLTKSTDHEKHCVWLLLHGILDPMNLGAILRSCYFFNVNGVIVTGSCSPLTPVVSKASSGASEILPIYTTDDSLDIVQEMQNDDWEVIGTVVEPGTTKPVDDVSKVALKRSTLVIFGNGMSGGWAPLLKYVTLFSKDVAMGNFMRSFDDCQFLLQGTFRLHLTYMWSTRGLLRPIVIGSEGDGLPEEVLDRCTRLLTISTSSSHLIKSLNVSAACAVILHALTSSATDR